MASVAKSGAAVAAAVFCAGLALVTAGTAATAGERSRGHGGVVSGYGHRDGGGIAIPYGGAGLPSFVRGLGTFAGSISAVREPGNGIYFAVDGDLVRARPVRYGVAPSAVKIITVTDRTEAESCSYEAGVCVIRP